MDRWAFFRWVMATAFLALAVYMQNHRHDDTNHVSSGTMMFPPIMQQQPWAIIPSKKHLAGRKEDI